VFYAEYFKTAGYNAKMNPNIVPLDQHLQDKHFYRKHGLNATYGQR